jgi:hypothetical protein
MALTNVELSALLLVHGKSMSSEFKVTSMQGFQKRSGFLRRSFKEKLVIQGGDIVGLSFNIPRYGYILNHGVKSQTVKRKDKSYTTKGFSGNAFIGKVLDNHAEKISDTVSKLYGKRVESAIRFR